MTSPAEQISRSATLSAGDADQIRALAARVAAHDGAPPLDEQAQLRLAHHTDGVEHVIVRTGSALLGYAQVEYAEAVRPPTTTGPATAEILVGLDGRRPEITAALFDRVEDATGDVLVWARGDASPVRAEAERRGYAPARTLLTMARPLSGLDLTDIDAVRASADGVTIRPFVPGRDDAAWLGVNARAFATHPEQGRWTQADLDERLAQEWFDPAGFLLAVAADDHLLGFHWTKRHSPELGEVYVIGIDPSAQGRGLGRSLLLAGLEYLQGVGAQTVILYTEADNQGAIRLYENTGFTVTRRLTQYRR